MLGVFVKAVEKPILSCHDVFFGSSLTDFRNLEHNQGFLTIINPTENTVQLY